MNLCFAVPRSAKLELQMFNLHNSRFETPLETFNLHNSLFENPLEMFKLQNSLFETPISAAWKMFC